MKQTDLNSQIQTSALAAGTLTAGGAGDNAEVTATVIDRNTPGGNTFLSAVLAIISSAVLAAAATLKLTVKIADSDDNVTFGADVTLLNAGTVSTGPGGGGTVLTATELGLDLSGYKRYVRIKITPDLSAANTDTATWAAALVMGGSNNRPV